MTELKENSPSIESEVVLRPATRDDMVAVLGMIQELADFENMPDGPKITAQKLQHDGFDTSPPAFRCLVAQLRGGPELAGYALYFPTYSTWEGPALMLEDLCVRSQYRKRGIGGLLFDAVANEAVSSGCSRVDFHMLEWNPARRFYESRGAVDLTCAERWAYCRLAGPELARRAALHAQRSH